MTDIADWEDLSPYVRAKGAPAAAPVRVGMSAPGRPGRLGKVRMVVLIDRALLLQLGGESWRYRVQLSGAGDRLRIAHGGPVEARDITMGLAKGAIPTRAKLVLAADPRFPNERIPAEGCDHQIIDAALIVDLPAWAWDGKPRGAAATAPPPPSARTAAPLPASVRSALGRRPVMGDLPSARALTAAVMGDPPPGRSALDNSLPAAKSKRR